MNRLRWVFSSAEVSTPLKDLWSVMNVDSQRYRTELSKLADLREQFDIRADSLPADLALAGLLENLLEAAAAAIQVLENSTQAVYPLARTAFEAAQRIVALATDDDYLRVGTRAWLYYQHKDAFVRRKTEPEKADQWLDATVSQMRDIWRPHNELADGLLADAGRWLSDNGKKKPRPADNFMGRDLADVVQERYSRMFGPDGIGTDVKQLNRGIYATLSRDSHARLRVEPAALTFMRDGTVRVIPQRTDETARQRTLLNCLELSLTEAVGALSYLLENRKRADAERLRLMADRAIAKGFAPGCNPDLGLHLARIGGARTTFHFQNVPIRKLGVLPDGTASWSANIVLADGEYIATFDVPPSLRNDLAQAIRLAPLTLTPRPELVRHDLDGTPCVRLECVLGELQGNGTETFLPLVVKRVTEMEATPQA